MADRQPKILPLNDKCLREDFGLEIHPLEEVAHILRRIDGHMARIAEAVERDESREKLRQQLQSIDQAIRIQGIQSKLHAQ